jgi:hypothetical protein
MKTYFFVLLIIMLRIEDENTVLPIINTQPFAVALK